MARGKKKESALTPEEKLAQALVPDWEWPYKVPENWCWTTLEKVATVVTGGTPSKNHPEYYEGTFPFYKPSDLDAGRYVYEASEYLSDEGKAVSRIIPQNSTAVCCIGSIGKCGYITREGTTNQQINSAIPRFNPLYLYYFLNTEQFVNELWSKASATTISIVNKSKMEQCYFPLAPLAEQQRIVDRIEYLFAKLDEAKEKVQSVLDSFETRKAAILHKAFTGELTARWRAEHGDQIGDVDVTPLDKAYDDYDVPHELPSSWRWVRFNDCCTFVGSGVTPKGGKEVYQTTGVPFIRSQNVLKGILDLSDVAYISLETDAMMKRTRILGGETLFNITGASIGRACFVPYCQTSGNVNQHVCILRYKNYVAPELPQFWLNSPAVQDFVVDNQIGQTRQALNFKQIRGMHYPLAPVGEQNEIVRILDSLFAKEQQAKEAAEAVLEKIDLLKKSILARAFRGELGTNNPTEESALKLLINNL